MSLRVLPLLLGSSLVMAAPLLAADNFLEGGNPADGQMIFQDSPTVDAKIATQGEGESAMPVFQLTLKKSSLETGTPDHIALKKQIYADPTRTYRLRVLVSQDGPMVTTRFCGYGFDLDGKLIRDKENRVWEYRLRENVGEGVPGATVWGCTIGPKGSQADYIWPDKIGKFSFKIYIKEGEVGDQINLQKILMEDVP